MQQRSTVRNWTEYLFARLLVGKLACLPRPLADWTAGAVTRVLDRAVPRMRAVAMRNLQMAFPEMPEDRRGKIVDGVYRSLARQLVVFSRFPRIDRRTVSRWIRYEGFEHFEEALRRGKGVLFATAHLGCWELSAFSHALMASPMHVVVRSLDNPLLDDWIESRRSLSGNRIIGRGEYARSILRALHKNEAVGILIDQNVAADEGVFVDFFGVPACAGSAFARFAAHSGATVIPGFALWEPRERRFVLKFYPPVPVTGDMVADTQALYRQLESVILQYPDQWLWIHRRWKTRPPGGTPIY